MSSLSSTPPWEKPKPNSAFKGFNFSGFTSSQITFAIDLAMETGLELGVIAAWLLAEESGSAAKLREATGNYNWLNIGFFDAGRGQISFANVWKTPDTAAAATARFLKGTYGGASAGIQTILGSVGKSASAQISAIQNSGWATSHYPNLPQIYASLAPGLRGAGSLKGAAPGGTAGAGGTGTLLNDSSGFRVGDASNPDEDYWTAINRLAQDRYWYVFSDGETIYVADGPDLMKQDVAMTLDRVADAGSITHLEFTFDNTAWSYSATRHKRHRAQRRTALARVTSPVEGLADVVCKIDEVRAGDVIEFDNCGPGDGKWLIGDVRRSVFEVTSEITIVPALTPLSEGQLNPAHQNTNNLSAFSTNITLGGYTNPVGNWIPGRIDAGVDGTLAGPYVAPGASEILIADAHNAGWQGGGYICGRFTDGNLKGKVWYVSEGVAPLVAPHSKVGAGTPVARTVPSPYNGTVGNIETGFASPTVPSLPLGFVGNKDDQGPIALAAGTSFNRFLIKLGAKPGKIEGRGIGVRPAPLPPGYP